MYCESCGELLEVSIFGRLIHAYRAVDSHEPIPDLED